MNSFDDLIFENNNALDKELCSEIIARFERDDRKIPGVTTSGAVSYTHLTLPTILLV